MNALSMFPGVRAVAKKLTLERQLDYWLAPPPRARIVRVVRETHDLATVLLAPFAPWPHRQRAGQYVTIGVEIDGVRHERCYSLSSPPGAPPELTVKATGRVSRWLHGAAGEVVELGPPQGTFVVPPGTRKLLLLTGGSGISPAMAILRDRRVLDTVFVHAARSAADVPFDEELREAGAHVFCDDVDGRLDVGRLRVAVPDLDERTTLLCGPPGMIEALAPAWANQPERLVLERFVRPPARGTETTVGPSARPILDELEAAGERPAAGCRRGICHTCVCRKTAGVVANIVTGAESGDGEEDIRICVSRPVTRVTLTR